jgi:predicted RNA-binding Zn ribbon-like protein
MRLVGGNPALDFLNSRSGPPDGAADDDVLTEYASLIEWAVYAGVLTRADSAGLTRLSVESPDVCDVAFARAIELRDYLDELFRLLSSGELPDGSVLARLRDDEATALAHAELSASSPSAWTWTWEHDTSAERPLWPVIHSAVELLTEGSRGRIKRCAGCRFIFYDESKNRSRRWCSMDDCGSAQKTRRYVAARRARNVTSGDA